MCVCDLHVCKEHVSCISCRNIFRNSNVVFGYAVAPPSLAPQCNVGAMFSRYVSLFWMLRMTFVSPFSRCGLYLLPCCTLAEYQVVFFSFFPVNKKYHQSIDIASKSAFDSC